MPHAKINESQRRRAKQLRQTMTRAETLLWRYLKAHHIDGLAFRRQVPMHHFIADFVSHAAQVIIEIDGASHDFESRQQRDRRRDKWFASQGYAVLRFTNEEVLKNLEGVIEIIRDTVFARLNKAPPSLTLPHKGGGNNPGPPTRQAMFRGASSRPRHGESKSQLDSSKRRVAS